MKRVRIVLIILILGVICALIFFPETYMQSVYGGLLLFGATVFPTMLPFFFFSRLLTSLEFADSLAKVAKKPAKFLYGAPPAAGYVLVMSMLTGYPVGAKLTADMYENGLFDEREARLVSTFTSTSGPLFVVGSIGSYMLGSKAAGLVILASHYLGTLINGLFYRRKCKPAQAAEKPLPKPGVGFDELLSDSVTGAVGSVLIVGAYICIFNMLADLFQNVGALAYAARFFGALFSPLGMQAAGEGIAYSLIEVTRGAMFLGKSSLTLQAKTAAAAAAVSFGGLSVALQSLTFLGKCKIKPSFYFLSKTTQAATTFAIALALSYVAL